MRLVPRVEKAAKTIYGFYEEEILIAARAAFKHGSGLSLTKDGALRVFAPVPASVPAPSVVAPINAVQKARLGHWNDAGSRIGKIYFIHSERSCSIKIGFSREPQKRLREIQTGSADRLVLLGSIPNSTYDEERLLHKKFAKLRLNGEWFTDVPELREYIAEAARR